MAEHDIAAGQHSSQAGVRITVSGSARQLSAPQRCTVHVRISHDGPARQEVQDVTARQLAAAREKVLALHDPERGPVIWWAADQLYTSQYRPYNNEGEQLPFVYSAVVTLAVKFSDLTQVSPFVAELAELNGVSVDRLDWTLTRATEAEQASKIRDAAVRDAVTKARAYAHSLGLANVVAVELSEPGLRQPASPEPRMYAALAGAPQEADLGLRPREVAVAAAVEAVFIAS